MGVFKDERGGAMSLSKGDRGDTMDVFKCYSVTCMRKQRGHALMDVICNLYHNFCIYSLILFPHQLLRLGLCRLVPDLHILQVSMVFCGVYVSKCLENVLYYILYLMLYQCI